MWVRDNYTYTNVPDAKYKSFSHLSCLLKRHFEGHIFLSESDNKKIIVKIKISGKITGQAGH